MRLLHVFFGLFLYAIGTMAGSSREFYDILGVPRTATQQEIKKAYRKLSQQFHPDHNQGDDKANEKFAKINVAYEALSDPEQRKKYDRDGEEGLRQVSQSDPFDDMFGSFFGGGRSRGEQKGPDFRVKVRVTLEDIYNGKEVPVYLTKQILCPHCRGSGADNPDDVDTCPQCKGVGYTVKKQQVAMGFYQTYQVTCEKCYGKGKVFKSKCHLCKGAKIIAGAEDLFLYVEKGIADGHTIKYENMADERQDMGTSDLVFQIVQIPHPFFQRKGNDLYCTIKISLKEALLGFKKKIKHLDAHFVKIEKDSVTKPGKGIFNKQSCQGEIQKVKGEGMPQHEFSSNHGDMYIEYQVEIPQKFTSQQMKLWEQFFQGRA